VTNNFQLGTWLVEPSLNTISRNGTTVQLEPKVMSVLVCLAEHAPEPVSKEELLKTVWPGTFVGEGVLTRSIFELRRVFEDEAKEPRVIQTIAKRGYRLVAPVVPVNGTNLSPENQSDAGTTKGRTMRLGMLMGVGLAVLLVVMLGVAPNTWWSRVRGTGDVPGIRSLAVLPLTNLSADPQQEYLSEGMTDALITELSQIGQLRVISRTTTSRYKTTEKSLPQIAQELSVDGIVEGTVQRSGDRVRVTAQLIYGPADRHLWAMSYERDLGDVLGLEQNIATAIAHEIQVRVTPEETARLKRIRRPNPKALDAYLQGRYHLNHVGRGAGYEDYKKAIEYFQRAIAEDPNFAPAYTWLAEIYDNSYSDSKTIMPLEKAAVSKALELDPDLAKTHQLLGSIRFYYDWNWPEAEREFKRSLELDSNSAWAHNRYSLYLAVMGQPGEAMSEAQKARELDPAGEYMSESLRLLGRYDEAIEVARQYLEFNSQDGFAHWNLFETYSRKGMQRETVDELEQTWRLFGFADVAARVRKAYGKSDYRAAMKESAKALEGLYARRVLILPGEIARDYVYLDDKEQALNWLRKAYEERDGELVFLARDAAWDPLRSDPRFREVVRRVGLPQ
jgi:TolB-like protein/DNA-binding winged helix-turn-helix (wHTH) protein